MRRLSVLHLKALITLSLRRTKNFVFRTDHDGEDPDVVVVRQHL